MAEQQGQSEVEPGFPIVGVGASAGGIEAFTELLKNLPDSPGLAFVFILHQDPEHKSSLAQVIARATRMPVEQIRDSTAVEVDRVYVSPPNAEVSIVDGVLHLHERTRGSALVDAFFRSLAEDQAGRAISVVLSGTASDGAIGTREIKAEGGITFAQDDTARMDGMPHAAVAAGFVDFVLSPADIADELLRIARQDFVREPQRAPLAEGEVLKLFGLIRSRHDIDFTHYRPSTIERRIRRRMSLRRVATVDEYVRVVRDEPQEAEQLYADILIKVTGFFRDPQAFEALEQDVFPELLQDRGNETVRAWVPGCATGEEAYSLAISILEAAEHGSFSGPIQIFGTDIDGRAIERARAGLYPDRIAAEMSAERLGRYFTKVEGGYRVNKAVRACCIFARQNVTKDPPFSKVDLISCRNVMIYFGTGLQRKVISIFHYALRPDGFLLLGTAETIGSFGELFAAVDRKNKIYRKKAAIVRPLVQFDMVKPTPFYDSDEARSENPLTPTAVFREADRVLLDRFSPSGVVINENLDVLQFRGHTSRYLEPAPGTASFNLLKMAREGLLTDLHAAIHAARKSDEPQRREGVRVKVDDHNIAVNLEVIPFVGASKEPFMLVLFEEPAPENKSRPKKKKGHAADASSKLTERLERELEATREYLQSIIEEQESMNSELRSANEEIQSSNEELQSTNEELETAKEELQSTNEELTTLNDELENRNRELGLLNNDLVNVLASIDIPVLMLDGALRIRRFNPGAERSLNLVSSDLGRPIADINTKLPLENLDQLVRSVIDTLAVRELEVRDRNGHMQSLRIRPYRTADNKIDGAVLVLIDLDEFRRPRAAEAQS